MNDQQKKIELIANISLIVIGLVLGVVFYLQYDKDLSIIMFSIALACILYQFLGGIGDSNSFQMGAIKFGGAAAILVGFMFFLKKVVFVPIQDVAALEISNEDWLPISMETGKIKPIVFQYADKEMVFPNEDMLAKSGLRRHHEYQLTDWTKNKFSLELKSNPTDTIGFVDINSFQTRGLFNHTEVAEDEKRIQVFTLYPEQENKNESSDISHISLPFNIETFQTSRFSIEPYLTNQEVVKRTCYLIPYDDEESYVVFLEQANSEDSIPGNRYSKWLVKKIRHTLE